MCAIKVSCHTNVDCKFGHWVFPEVMCCKPSIGDEVQGNGGTLKVCRIVHDIVKIEMVDEDGGKHFDYEPYLSIELNKGAR